MRISAERYDCYSVGLGYQRPTRSIGKAETSDYKICECFSGKTMLKTYGEKVIARYEKSKRFGMANSLKDAVDTLLRYHGSEHLFLSDIDEVWLEDLEADYVSRVEQN